MAEDYTYDAVTDVTTLRRTAQEANKYALCMEDKANELAARVQELEHQLAQADSNMVALAARNAELAARLDAVPEYATYYYNFDGWEPVKSFDEWYSETHTPRRRHRRPADVGDGRGRRRMTLTTFVVIALVVLMVAFAIAILTL